MKKDLLNFIQNSKREGRKLIAILIDPDKVALKDCKSLADQLNQSSIDLVFVGGSTVEENVTEEFLKRANFNKPVALFPRQHKPNHRGCRGYLISLFTFW